MMQAVLEQNPKFRAIHSKDSVQKIIEKARCHWDESPFMALSCSHGAACQVRGDQVVDVPLARH